MRFRIKKSTTGKMKGQFHFVLIAANNKIIATSETYFNRNDCIDTIYSIIRECKNAVLEGDLT